jgi:hypothetical protein
MLVLFDALLGGFTRCGGHDDFLSKLMLFGNAHKAHVSQQAHLQIHSNNMLPSGKYAMKITTPHGIRHVRVEI